MHEGWAEDMYTKQSFEIGQDDVTQMERQRFRYHT